MSAREKGGQKGPPLPPEKIGRMIRALQQDAITRGYWHSYSRSRRHTDEEIRVAFGITKEEFKFFLDKYMFRRDWDSTKVRKAFFAFVDKNGRWPTKTDYRRWRLTGLPYPETIGVHIAGNRFDAVMGVSALMLAYVRNRSGKKVTPEMVLAIPNITTRRTAIAHYGYERLMGAGELVQEDSYGKLWRLPTDGSDPFMQFVEVVNKTPRMDADGAYVLDKSGGFVYDHYFLRVPPTITSAERAVAWTFNRQLISFSAES